MVRGSSTVEKKRDTLGEGAWGAEIVVREMTGNEGDVRARFQPLTAVAGFRGPRLRLIRSNNSSVTVSRHVVGVYLITPEVEKQVVNELLLVSVAKRRELREVVRIALIRAALTVHY